MRISTSRMIRGSVDLPGDKSISHRAALFSSIADGTALIGNYSASADCASTLACLRRLGVNIEVNGPQVNITGTGKNGLKMPTADLDCGNSGTTMRLLSGILAGQNFRSVLTGDESLKKRPMGRVIEPLEKMGAGIESNHAKAPLAITGRNPLNAIDYTTPVASAQIKSCVLLAGLYADGITTVTEREPTRDHTERMLRYLGVEIAEDKAADGNSISVSGDSRLVARDMSIPGDISASAFFIVAAACLAGSELTINDVGLNPSRTGILEVLRGFEVDVKVENKMEVCGEPVADLMIRSGVGLGNPVISGSVIPNIIDEIPVLAIFATQLDQGLEVRDAAELRVKECDRIHAIVENLRRMGADIEEFPDGFRVSRSKLKGAGIDTFGDHRIAMAFAIAGLMAEGDTVIEDAACAAVSFPAFFEMLDRVVVR